MFAFMAFCTQLARLPDRATDRGAYKKPKVQKMDGINPDYQVYSSHHSASLT